MENKTEYPRTSALLKLVPTWKGNLLLFGILIVIVLAYFYWQVHQAQKTFLDNVRLNSGMLASVIKRNASTAVLSQQIVEEIIQTFLGSTARFVDYLNDIEPFSSAELTSYAQEAELAGIRITGQSDVPTEGPLGWFSDQSFSCDNADRTLRHLSNDHLYYLGWPRANHKGCIIVGIAAFRIEKLQEQIGLPRLLETLSGLGGIRYVRIVQNSRLSKATTQEPEINFIGGASGKIAETRLSLERGNLLVGMDAKYYFDRVNQLWREFFTFSALLAAVGLFFSWLLYRFQSAYLAQLRDFEREMARQHEDASLGRAAASITHEIKNPLNAISMGLQRLQIESEGISQEHQDLISTMRKAVQRMDGIIKDMRRYARPISPNYKEVHLNVLVDNLLTLYGKQCEALGIELTFNAEYKGPVSCDRDLIEEALENLVKNGIEAQPKGGFLKIVLTRGGPSTIFVFENPGFSLTANEAERIIEPYFTTKTRGTGLGLSIAKRIIHAHGGRFEIDVPEEGLLRVSVFLPSIFQKLTRNGVVSS